MIAKFIIRNLIHKMTALIYGTDVTNIRCSILGWCILVYFVKPTLNKWKEWMNEWMNEWMKSNLQKFMF